VFRAIARSIDERDYVLEMLLDHIGVDLDYEEAVGVTYDDVRHDLDAALSKIVERFKAVEAKCDAVVIVGRLHRRRLDERARLQRAHRREPRRARARRAQRSGDQGDRLGVSVPRTPQQLAQLTELALTDITHQRAELFAVITNRADPAPDEINAAIGDVVRRARGRRQPRGRGRGVVHPRGRSSSPRPCATSCSRSAARLLRGDEALLVREVLDVVVAGMSLNNILPRLTEGAIVIVPADRTEVLLDCCWRTRRARSLDRGHHPQRSVPAAARRAGPHGGPRLAAADHPDRPGHLRHRRPGHEHARPPAAGSQRRYDTALALFEQHVDTDEFTRALGSPTPPS
jgi:phosphate acetyltransferase